MNITDLAFPGRAARADRQSKTDQKGQGREVAEPPCRAAAAAGRDQRPDDTPDWIRPKPILGDRP